ncbi:hypothetical protein [Chroococcus sp. FPU101]|uniref:hypothetical protein n=1 Tax=Chroococcus sp. FPU101 TaxID=1974212 RepID=UPI001A8F3F05|nr:hypothetical protein [Chroococcus sp. FPU101]GFE71981.1 hypothetical protein CFPU101_45910 [Chroococcus sp. FPU101]
MSPVKLSHKGFQALVDLLGYVNAVGFSRHEDHKIKDYTQERHQWLDQLTTDEILADLAFKQNQEIPE